MRQSGPTRLFCALLFAAVTIPCLSAQQPSPASSIDAATAAAPLDAPTTTPAPDEQAPDHLPGESLVRIVRLSQERGVVLLDRNTGQGFERTAPNMPLVQGVRLRTVDGLAEVEFEDSSSIRLTPGTQVDFPQMKLRQTGVKVTAMHVLQGSVYVSLAAGHDDEISLAFADQTLTLAPSSHIHLFVGQPVSRLVVFSGEARVQGPLGIATATKKQTLTFDSTKAYAPVPAKGLIEDAYDQWDKDAVGYAKRYAVANTFAGSPYSYGLADLNYYGGYFNTAGCGQMWQPYFAGAGWSPYSAGLWTWYPGAGYSWVSMYPWGWTPFHSGQWAFCQGRGWGWRPSGGWSGVNNLRRLKVTGIAGGTPIKPPAPPQPHQPTLSLVKSGTATPMSGLQPSGEFRFQNDSAGLGVPRGAFDRLNKISRAAGEHGSTLRLPSEHAIITIAASRPVSGTAWAGASGHATGASARSSSNAASHASSSSAASSAGRSSSSSSSAASTSSGATHR